MGTILEVTKYLASDGTMFDTREECQSYEDMNKSIIGELKNKVKFITDDRNIIGKWKGAVNKDDFEANFEHAINQCTYIEIMYDISKDAIIYLDEWIGVIIPTKSGIYRYDDNHCVWLSLKYDVDELEAKWNMSVAEIARNV